MINIGVLNKRTNYQNIFDFEMNNGRVWSDQTTYKVFNSFATFDFTTKSRSIKIKAINTYANLNNIIYCIADGVVCELNYFADNTRIVDTFNTTLKNITVAIQGNIKYLGLKGCWPYSIEIDTNKDYEIIKDATPNTRYLVIGDSIGNGALATSKYSQGYAMLLRHSGKKVSISGGSGYSIELMYNELTEAVNEIDDLMDGTNTNKLVLVLGTNDYMSNPSTINTYYNAILDAIHSQRSDILIYCVAPTIRQTESNLETIRTNIQASANDRPSYCTFLNLKNVVDISNFPDGLHPNTEGHQLIYDYLNVNI